MGGRLSEPEGPRGLEKRGLAIVKAVRERVDREAEELAAKWSEHRVAIRGSSHERQQVFEEIRAAATEPQRGELKRARTRMEDSGHQRDPT